MKFDDWRFQAQYKKSFQNLYLEILEEPLDMIEIFVEAEGRKAFSLSPSLKIHCTGFLSLGRH